MERCKLVHDGQYVVFFCPGCRWEHNVPISPLTGHTVLWTFNGDLEYPTIDPSVLNHAAGDAPQCHLVVSAGVIHYASDCDHGMAGQAIVMQPIKQ